jgi:hypothetical protein
VCVVVDEFDGCVIRAQRRIGTCRFSSSPATGLKLLVLLLQGPNMNERVSVQGPNMNGSVASHGPWPVHIIWVKVLAKIHLFIQVLRQKFASSEDFLTKNNVFDPRI